MIDVAQRHFLGGLLYQRTRDYFGSSPLTEWRAQAIKNIVLLDELRGFETICAKRGLRPVRLKGSSLMSRFYPDLGSRHLCDVDILVDSGELSAVHEILQGLGYRPDPVIDFIGSRNRMNWDKRHPSGIDVGVDLHTRISWRQPDDLRLKVARDADGFLRLDDDTEFLHLILNWIDQDTCVSFNKMMDIYFYYVRLGPHFNWLGWLENASRMGFGRSCRLAFLILQETFRVPTVVQPKDRREAWALGLLRSGWLNQPRGQRFKYYCFKHITKPVFQSLQYDFHWTWANLRTRILL